MPIKIIEDIPVRTQLRAEQINTIENSRAMKQDIRPLRILILNLMPKKEITELQLLRLLSNTPLQIDVEFLYTSSHQSENTAVKHLQQFYKEFADIKDQYYDGLIITGAPVEHLDFLDIDYIHELDKIMRWSQQHVFSRLFICWAALYALNFDHNIDKIRLKNKLFGIYPYKTLDPHHPLLRGFDDFYNVPQSRHMNVDYDKIKVTSELVVLSEHPTFGPDILTTLDQRDVFILGHLEYDRDTLKQEYDRDVLQGKVISLPENYFPNDDPDILPNITWKSHGHLLYNNWLNATYQNTLYNLNHLSLYFK